MEKETEALRRKNEAIAKVIRQNRELAHHQRLQTIGMLTSSIAHEFNNLLTPIMGYSLMTLEKLQPEQELYDDILEIDESSCKAKEIISRLNDLSRKNTDTSFRLMSPDVLIRKTIAIAKPAKPENVQVKLDLNCDDQRLNANEIQFTQLLLNLILNGFHAMEPEGGILTLTTNFDEESVHILVSDTGCGIAKEIQTKIFEPFFTTKETGKGTGLGLAIAAQVVEDHMGNIRVESKEGSGTTFFVSLPRLRAPLEE
jgi:signal transduction histidine kinase